MIKKCITIFDNRDKLVLISDPTVHKGGGGFILFLILLSNKMIHLQLY